MGCLRRRHRDHPAIASITTVAAVWVSLRVTGFARPGVSAGLFLLCVSILIPVVAGLGSLLLPVNIGVVPVGACVTVLVAGFLAAILARLGAGPL